ncbi:helix-turn-helix domain-containing protein [Pedobacter sp. HMF7647]|uniref:Helix-turn-helix domain-containing protein n=1 Tax=Hufsiella arboris TaxID=2695275 RepID=A0A7K1YE93_9SPHI|nr:helix-turn-helix domain-containing protein [Hufsiella arboris]MXV52359.1 helix-turn-helix domain-containing protein [Hufsiella arboris]
MKHISILVPERAIMGSIEGPRQLFTQVNQFFTARGKEPLFDIQLVGLKSETVVSGGIYTIHSDILLKEVKHTDLIIIPAIDGEFQSLLEINKDFIPWISKQYHNGAEVASLCMGAFILASTGLLDGKKCATHWMAANEFRRMFPDVNLIPERLITDEKGLYSSGGAFSYLNLILYLIEKYAGRDISILCAKVFAIEIDRESQSPFIIFQGQKEHEDDSIRKAQEFIESNFRDKITVDQLADTFAIGRRNLERRFKKATSNTVMEYIQRVKVEAAKKNFETSKKNINEVMYDVGYSDVKAFRTIFKKITGLSPTDYRSKYNKELIVA